MKYDFTTVCNRHRTGSSKWDEIKEFGVEREDIVPLSTAEMEFDNAPEIKEGLKEYISSFHLSYYDPIPSYFETVCEWFRKRHNFVFPQEAVVPNCSIHSAVNIAVQAFTEPGDGIVVIQPVWPAFLGAVKKNGRTLIDNVLLEKDCRYTIDFESLEKSLSDEKTKMIILCSPHNPVGRSFTYEELSRIGNLCVKYDVVIVSDEAHSDLTMPAHKHIPIATVSDAVASRTITFTGAGKPFNIAGLDSSNVIITNEELRKKYLGTRRLEGLHTPNMIGLKAIELAYTKGEEWLDECISVIYSNYLFAKDYLEKYIPRIKCTELEATYLMWLDFRAFGMDPKTLEKELKLKANVFMDDGFYFGAGGDRFMRMNISCPRSALSDELDKLRDWAANVPE